MMACAPFHAGELDSLDAEAEVWRAASRFVDLHQHVNSTEEHLRRCIRIMDAVGVGVVVNLSGGTVTHKPGEVSELQRNKELADRLFPGRFLLYFSLDYTGWDEPDFAERAVRQVEDAHRLGAAGLKEFKRLGLYLRDRGGRLIPVDDSNLDPAWRRCGELGMPVSIHVADPQAFWRPYDSTNERWEELKDHPAWWFGEPARYPAFQDRILFGTDFQVYDRLILGSSGNEPPPTDEQAVEFFAKHWRWLETDDRRFAHMTPIQGNWTIDAIGLPPEVLRKVYFDNARRLLVRSLPPPVIRAPRIARDFKPNGRLPEEVWQKAPLGWVDATLKEGMAQAGLATQVRVLWSDRHLYVAFQAPYSELTVFKPVSKRERLGLWDRDVVEVFVGPEPERINHYAEFEVAPTGEKLDVLVDLPDKDFAWSGRLEAGVKLDRRRKVWTTELRIPFEALGSDPPRVGQRWRLNLYRHSVADRVFLAWSPTATATAHTPERFGWIEFVE